MKVAVKQPLLTSLSLQEIAREKAGIFKRGRPAITVPQDKEAQQSLDVSSLLIYSISLFAILPVTDLACTTLTQFWHTLDAAITDSKCHGEHLHLVGNRL